MLYEQRDFCQPVFSNLLPFKKEKLVIIDICLNNSEKSTLLFFFKYSDCLVIFELHKLKSSTNVFELFASFVCK